MFSHSFLKTLAMRSSASCVRRDIASFLCFYVSLGSSFTLGLTMSSYTGEDLGFLLGFFGRESFSLRGFSFAFSYFCAFVFFVLLTRHILGE